MAKDIIYRNQLNITIIAFPILMLFASLLLALPSAFSSSEKEEVQKQMCVDNYEAEWKDGKCHFGPDNGLVSDEVEYEADLGDKGLWDDYADRTYDKDDWKKAAKYMEELYEEPQFEDKIPSTIITDREVNEDFEEEPAEIVEEEEESEDEDESEEQEVEEEN